MKSFFILHTRWNVDFSSPSGTVWKSHCTGGPWGTITRFWKTKNLHLLDYLRQTKESCHGATWWQTATVQLWGPLMINTMGLHLHKHFLTSQDFKLLLFCYWPHIFCWFPDGSALTSLSLLKYIRKSNLWDSVSQPNRIHARIRRAKKRTHTQKKQTITAVLKVFFLEPLRMVPMKK